MRRLLPLLLPLLLSLLLMLPAWAAASSGLRYRSGMRAADRKVVAHAVHAGRPDARRILRRLGGMIPLTVRSHLRPRDVSWADPLPEGPRSRATLDFGYDHLHRRPAGYTSHIIWHEIGHVFDYIVISSQGHRDIMRYLHRTRGWKRCFRDLWHNCVPEDEILADQFAFWANRDLAVRGGYQIPPLGTARGFQRVLFRSLSWDDFNSNTVTG